MSPEIAHSAGRARQARARRYARPWRGGGGPAAPPPHIGLVSARSAIRRSVSLPSESREHAACRRADIDAPHVTVHAVLLFWSRPLH